MTPADSRTTTLPPHTANAGFTGFHLDDCVFGAARDFVNNDGNGTRATQFCALVPTTLRGYCFYGIGTILGTFGHDQTWLDRTCQTLAVSRRASECEGSLNSQEQQLVTPGTSVEPDDDREPLIQQSIERYPPLCPPAEAGQAR